MGAWNNCVVFTVHRCSVMVLLMSLARLRCILRNSESEVSSWRGEREGGFHRLDSFRLGSGSVSPERPALAWAAGAKGVPRFQWPLNNVSFVPFHSSLWRGLYVPVYMF